MIQPGQSFKRHRTPDGFPTHGILTLDFIAVPAGEFSQIVVEWTLVDGTGHGYVYGYWSEDFVIAATECLLGNTVIGGLSRGEYYNLVIRKFLVFKS